MAVESKVSPKLFYGASTDTKPTEDVPIASVFIETDTGDEFLWLDTWFQHKGALSSYMTMTTLLAGESNPLSVNGWIEISATSRTLHEPDMTAANYDPWTLNNEVAMGAVYRGSGGLIILDDYFGNTVSVTMEDSSVFGLQQIHCKFRKLYQNGSKLTTPLGSETVNAFTGARDITVYMTGSLA